ncbi:MAG: fibronectin type III domain-containing protein [Candidatus Poribacteria bacterium]|nr:fibronectin type III domain-containing protein [Candidatus Poribacteria bacterium]
MLKYKIILWIMLCSILFLYDTYVFSQEPETTPPENVTAVDTPNDDGSSITVTWDSVRDDSVRSYKILRNTDGGEFEEIEEQLDVDTLEYKDSNIEKGKTHAYVIQAITDTDAILVSLQTEGVIATGQWFHSGKIQLFIAMIIFCGAILGSIYLCRNNQDVFVRRIPGLEAVNEAIGRATEMGRSILYVLGLGGVENVATIASMTILGQVARRTADYETPLRVPCNDPIVLNVVREMVKTSYLDEGRPDAYQEENIFYLTGDQFAYAAGVDGMMIREKPAAVFLQGTFYAESLLMAETGNSIGAIQIAGTDSEHQLPFFIAACDYTLIGEELYAASAYLSKEPMLLGSLRGQDWGKILIFVTIILGVTLELFGINWITTLLQSVR